MDWPRLRKDPMTAEKGAVKHARAAIRHVLEGGAVTIRVAQLNKSWGWRKGQWVAWVEECGEDEYGFCATGQTAGAALNSLSHSFHRVIHVCTKYPHAIKTSYRKPGWAWAKELQEID